MMGGGKVLRGLREKRLGPTHDYRAESQVAEGGARAGNIRKDEPGATFLSGTTISNSLTELYLLFKYLRPKELERQNIRTFDAWAAIFAKKTIDYEFSVTNEVVQKERFRYFIKVPELAMFYSRLQITARRRI